MSSNPQAQTLLRRSWSPVDHIQSKMRLKKYGYDSIRYYKIHESFGNGWAFFSDEKRRARQRLCQECVRGTTKRGSLTQPSAKPISRLYLLLRNNTTNGAKIYNQREKESDNIKKLKAFDFTRSNIIKDIANGECESSPSYVLVVDWVSEGGATNVNNATQKNPPLTHLPSVNHTGLNAMIFSDSVFIRCLNE